MALRQPDAVAVGSGEAQTFLVVSSHCQLRPAPNHDFVAIGLLRSGTVIRGFPHVSAGQPWLKLHDEEAAIYVKDRYNREDGVWVPHVSPKFGRLIQAQDQDVRYGQDASKRIREGGKAFSQEVTLRGKGSYEETLLLEWKVSAQQDRQLKRTDSVIELCIDSASGRPPVHARDARDAGTVGNGEFLKPAEGVIIKRMECGTDTSTSLSNMPDGRYFLASVIVTFEGDRKIRSPWIRVATLHKAGRDRQRADKDVHGNVRGKCTQKGCPCDGWVAPVSLQVVPAIQAFCRRCACRDTDHVLLKPASADEEESAKTSRQGTSMTTESSQVITFPPEARSWDERQCNLWRWSNGALHPTENPHAARRRSFRQIPKGASGKVTVVVPTTEERQYFHEQVWKCFSNQTWPNKELIVIETYRGGSSPVFNRVAAEDNRLRYLKFRCGHAMDLSIGSKRNIAMLCADGDYVASFDDDDIYAPTYLETMITELVNQKAHFITLSTWYFFEVKTGLFGFCDPYAWAKANKYTEKQMYGWLWGYGFSYVHHLKPALDRQIYYPDQNMAEDITFVRAWKSLMGDASACLLFDKAGIVLHTIHGRNTSNSFALREVPREEVLDTDFADLYDVLKHYLENFPRKDGASNFILNQVSGKQRTKRRYRQLVIHHDNGQLSIKCVRGVTGAELRRACAAELRTSPDLLRVCRHKPESVEALVEFGSEQDAQDQQKEPADPMQVVLGSWVYGSKQIMYSLSRAASGDLQFEGPHARCGKVTGKLETGWGWMHGDLRSPEGEHVGSIRLRWVQEVDSMLSNFRPLAKDWGKDIIAKRVGEYRHEVYEEAPLVEQKNQNAPLRDDERLELSTAELWLVLLPMTPLDESAEGSATQHCRSQELTPQSRAAQALQRSPAAEDTIQKSTPVVWQEEMEKYLSMEEDSQGSTSVDEACQKNLSVEEASLESASVGEECYKNTSSKEALQKTTSAEDGGRAYAHDDLGRHVELTIYIDADLGLKEIVRVNATSTIWNVKEELANLDITGETTPGSFDLKWLGVGNVPLKDAEPIFGGSNVLELCV